MKKFSKVLTGVLSALLLTVGGVFLASCSNDDDETKTPSLTVSGDAITVESGKTVTATVKGTLADDSFKALAVADFPASCVTVTSDDFTVGTIALKEALTNGATVATITVNLTAKTVTAEKKGNLTVKVSLPAEALNSGKAIEKTGTVAYTITAATTPDPTPTPSGDGNYELDLSAAAELGKVDGTTAKLDDTVTIMASKSGKSIQALKKDSPLRSVVKMTSTSANKTSGEEYGLQLTLAKAAKITIEALTKQGQTAGQWVLKAASGSDITSTGTPAVASQEIKLAQDQDTTPATLTFASVPAGTYILGAASQGGYLFSLKIEYTD